MMEPAWDRDRIDYSFPPEHRAPHFDDSLGAWVLSRYADVLAAFHCSSLFPAGLNSKPPSDLLAGDELQKMRRETRDALSPLPLRVWRQGLGSPAPALVHNRTADIPS